MSDLVKELRAEADYHGQAVRVGSDKEDSTAAAHLEELLNRAAAEIARLREDVSALRGVAGRDFHKFSAREVTEWQAETERLRAANILLHSNQREPKPLEKVLDEAEIADAFDANVERLKACEHIAEGDPEWGTLRNLCPSTAAVASLRDGYERLRAANKALVEAMQYAVELIPVNAVAARAELEAALAR